MNTITRLTLLLALILGVRPLALAADAKPAVPESPLAPLASLVGGVWSGDLPPDKDGSPMKIVLQFAWAENKQGVRFDSSFVQGSKRSPYTSGMYGWNGATRKLVIFYTDMSGSLVEGPVSLDGDVLVHELTITDKSGKVDVAQVRLARVNADVFTNTIFLRKDGAWVKFVEVRYERHE
jgi:hypothetical protein